MNTSKLIPYYVALELTKACDLRCIHCGSAADTHNRDEPLSLGQWKTLINDLKDLGTRDFQLSGGEPFLYQYWRELVYHIRTSQNIPASVTFITNGQQPEVDDVRYCKEMGVSHFAVSLDGPQSIHSYIRQSKKAFDRVLRLIKLCNSEKLPISILTAVNSYNINHLDELKHILLPLNIYTWQLQVVNSFGRAGEADNMMITHDQYIKLTDYLLALKEEGKITIHAADSIGYCHPVTDKLLGEKFEWQGCNAGLYVLGIESNGNVKGCLSLQDDYFLAGNITKESIKSIWGNDKNFAYTRLYDHKVMCGNCKNCESSQQCLAGCLGIAYSVHGNIYENSYCYKSILGSLDGNCS